MYFSSKLRNQLRVAKQLKNAGVPENGWGPSLPCIREGRHEFAGKASSGSWASNLAIIYVYSDHRTHLPASLELRFVDPQGNEILETRDEVSSGDAWSPDEIDHLLSSLEPQNIIWLDPVDSFKLAY